MKNNKVLFTKVKENAIIPTRESSNAGWDIYICPDEKDEVWLIDPNETKLIPTGIASVVPEGYYMQIQERSSTGSKGLKYSCGVIDSNYRGEWKIALYNSTNKTIVLVHEDEAYKYEHNKNSIVHTFNKALVQAVIHEIHPEILSEEISYEEFKEYQNTDRGDKGFGNFTNK